MEMKLICIGDSLTYGYGVPRSACWAALFAQRSGWEVVNCGVNGDTTGGMLARLRFDVLNQVKNGGTLDQPACRVIVMGGTNDIFFSGTDVQARANMTAICHQLAAVGCPPLVGIPLPVDWSRTPEKWAGVVDFYQSSVCMMGYRDWLKRFAAAFGLTAVDFAADFLQPTGQARHELLLDGIHPNEEGHCRMEERLSLALSSC